MDLTPYVEELEETLTAAAAVGDEQAQRTATALTRALEAGSRLAIMSALSELAAEVTASLGDRIVEVRLDGSEIRVSVSDPTPGPEAPVPPAPTLLEGGDLSRITLRLPDDLKTQAEQAAAREGTSLNTWLVRAVQHNLRSQTPVSAPGRTHNRVRGWVES